MLARHIYRWNISWRERRRLLVTRFMNFFHSIQVEQLYQFLFPIFDTFHLLVHSVYFFIESIQIFSGAILCLTLDLYRSSFRLKSFIEHHSQLSFSFLLFLLWLDVLLYLQFGRLGAIGDAADTDAVVLGTESASSLDGPAFLLLLLETEVLLLEFELTIDKLLQKLTHLVNETVKRYLVFHLRPFLWVRSIAALNLR